MSISARIFAPRNSSDIITTAQLAERLAAMGGTSTTGMTVNAESAMRQVTVLACVVVLAQSLAQLPCNLMETKETGKVKAYDRRLYSLLHDAPNEFQTAYHFWQTNMAKVALHGNAYAYKVMVGNEVRELLPIPHGNIEKVEQDHNYKLWYTVRFARQGGTTYTETIPQENIFHLRGLSLNGYTGLNPIAYARESIGLAQAAERFGGKMYSNGAKISGVLTHPGRLSPAAEKNLRTSFEEKHSSIENAFKTMILEEGVKFTPGAMNAQDAQFLDNRKFQRTEICALFRVPPHMVADLERATFSNIEQQDLGFVKHTMAPYLVNFEQEIKQQLIAQQDRLRLFAKFNANALLRGDFKSRMEGYGIGIQNSITAPNEARDLEDMPPYPGGEKHQMQQNMTFVSEGGTPNADSK